MEEWLLMQGLYHGLTQKSHEQLNVTTGGSFMSLTLGNAKVLMEKIASNQGWSSCNIQSCNKSKEVPEEVCALSTKMDILLSWLEQRDNYKRDRQAIQDAFNAQNKCGEYLGVEFPKSQEDINIVINNSAPLQQRQGWNQQPRSTYQGKHQGNYYNPSNSKQPSLRDLILEQARIIRLTKVSTKVITIILPILNNHP
jgi:hypothetical protein